MSIKPGATIRLAASISSISDCGLLTSELGAILPSTISTSSISSRLFAGSITRPLRMMVALISGSGERTRPRVPVSAPRRNNLCAAPLMKKFAMTRTSSPAREGACAPQRKISHSRCDSPAEIKDGHADGETVGHLIENDALQSVGDVAIDLDPTINRSGVHDQTIRIRAFCQLLR